MKEKKTAGYWTYERCLNEAHKYKFKIDFRYESAGAYYAAKNKGWLAEYTWLESRSITKWTYDTCYEEAKKSKTRSAFAKGATGAYSTARENGWLDDYVWFVSDRNPAGYWTYETCYEEAKKYKSRSEYQYGKGSGQAYRVARANGWIKDYTWFEEKQKPSGYWTYERCYEEAKKYKTRTSFQRGECGSRPYKVARANGWLDDYTWFEELSKPAGYWSYERCAEESKKYASRGEFKKGNPSAYAISLRNGWLGEFFPENQ